MARRPRTWVVDLRHYLSEETEDLAETDSMEIVWDCPWCGENGVIRGWEDTLWDRRPAADGDGH
jgi:hypothetical protein